MAGLRPLPNRTSKEKETQTKAKNRVEADLAAAVVDRLDHTHDEAKAARAPVWLNDCLAYPNGSPNPLWLFHILGVLNCKWRNFAAATVFEIQPHANFFARSAEVDGWVWGLGGLVV